MGISPFGPFLSWIFATCLLDSEKRNCGEWREKFLHILLVVVGKRFDCIFCPLFPLYFFALCFLCALCSSWFLRGVFSFCLFCCFPLCVCVCFLCLIIILDYFKNNFIPSIHCTIILLKVHIWWAFGETVL